MDQPSQALDSLTHTFTADRKFFDDLMTQPSGEMFLEMCVWYIWLRDYLHDMQNSLHEGGKSHGANYQIWVVSMIGGAAQSIGMMMYLSGRGVVHEAAASGRRALEYLGVVCHLVRDPAKAQYLGEDEGKQSPFEKAFIRGQDRPKLDGVRYRFAGMSSGSAKSATKFWEIFSQFNVHGDNLRSLTGIALAPTANSCAFHNRSVDETARNLLLLKPVLEITAIELIDLVGRYGVRSKRINEAGACVLVWLDRTDQRWLDRLQVMRKDLGLATPPEQRPN